MFPASVAVLAVLILGGSVFAAATSAKTKTRRIGPRHLVQIFTLSTRADLVSGGEALTQITLPRGANASRVKVTLGKANVTREFAVRANGKFEGLVTGLRSGTNVLKAVMPDGYGARLTITNHPIGGPVFSGPQIQPWQCQSGASDPQCDQAPGYAYYYVPAGQANAGSNGAGQGDTNAFQPYDPSNPPPASAIATTTTTDGVTVPFIVREETGYMDRDQYAIATLWQPGQAWQPWAPQRQYNGRLVIMHGASCDTTYGTGTAPDVKDQKVIGAGFIVMSTALDNAGHNCNLLTEAESLEMGKEWVVDHYGEIKWTIGSGCSGGSLVQQQVANAYPGIYQGITPQCSFTDAWSSAMEYEDYYMLLNYWETKDQTDAWGPTQQSAVIDNPNPLNPVTFTTAIPNSGKADRSCPDVPQSEVFNPQTNPHGVRCTLEDYMVNMFGRDPSTGYANVPFSNVGIQYGLAALKSGQLTPQQFADLNAHVGGLDDNGDFSAARADGQLIAFQRAYRDGAVDTASNLNQIPIIDLRGPDYGTFHDVYRTYAMRDRLLQNFGTAANQVLWQGPVPLIGDPSFADDAIFAMDGWIAKISADHRNIPQAQKVIQDKPATLADRCTDGNGNEVPMASCQAVVQSFGTPRFEAGEPHTDDILKCQLKPLNPADYLPIVFTPTQWQELQQAFPNGVCDYSKPGVGQGPTTTWMTYQDQQGHVIYGGRPMGPAPVSVPFGPRAKAAKKHPKKHRKHRMKRAVKPAFTG
jgi:heme-degrading monooxygenase HmoA